MPFCHLLFIATELYGNDLAFHSTPGSLILKGGVWKAEHGSRTRGVSPRIPIVQLREIQIPSASDASRCWLRRSGLRTCCAGRGRWEAPGKPAGLGQLWSPCTKSSKHSALNLAAHWNGALTVTGAWASPHPRNFPCSQGAKRFLPITSPSQTLCGRWVLLPLDFHRIE